MLANTKPQPIAMSPGSANAARQPRNLTASPVDSAASAMPMLPESPLTPIVQPGRCVDCSSMGMPTGW